MSRFGPSPIEQRQADARHAMAVGLTLDEIPIRARGRLLRLATNYGFEEKTWYTRQSARALVQAARIICAHEEVLGMQEVDLFRHRVSSWLA